MKEYIYKINGVLYKKGPAGYALYQSKSGWRESAYMQNSYLLTFPAYKIIDSDKQDNTE